MVQNYKKNDEGVSAVIGVILMVAITVVLAAVIAAFVFQMSSNVPKNKQVGVEVKRVLQSTATTDGIIAVKTLSGADIGLLEDGEAAGVAGANHDFATYTITVNGAAGSTTAGEDGCWCTSTNAGALPAAFAANQIGTALYFNCPSNADVTVTALFTDGSKTAIWTGQVP